MKRRRRVLGCQRQRPRALTPDIQSIEQCDLCHAPTLRRYQATVLGREMQLCDMCEAMRGWARMRAETSHAISIERIAIAYVETEPRDALAEVSRR